MMSETRLFDFDGLRHDQQAKYLVWHERFLEALQIAPNVTDGVFQVTIAIEPLTARTLTTDLQIILDMKPPDTKTAIPFKQRPKRGTRK